VREILSDLNENKRFYLGWGFFVIVFALSLIIQSIFGNFGITLGFFFTILALCLIAIGLTKPAMPLVTQFGGLFLLAGIAVFAILVANINPLLVVGIIILIFGIFLLVVRGRKCNV